MKRTKKLISALLAIVMIASLSVTALAEDEPSIVVTPDRYKTTSTASTNAQVKTADNYEGTDDIYAAVSGTIGNEGKVPEGTVSIVMPTVTPTMFNMILDPHDLIKSTTSSATAGRYGKTDKVTFAETAKGAYFNTATAANTYTFSDKSNSLKVFNRGYWPVDVTLSAELDKTNAGGDVVNVATRADLTSDAYKETPAMYLAVTGKPTKEGDTFTVTPAVVSDAWGLPTLTTTDTYNLLTIDPTFTYADNIKTSVKKAFETAASGNSGADGTITLKVTKGDSYTIAASFPDGKMTGYSFAEIAEDSVPSATNNEGTLDIQYKPNDDTDAYTIATIALKFDMVGMSALADGAEGAKTATIKFAKFSEIAGGTTSVEVANTPEAWTLSWNSTNKEYEQAKNDRTYFKDTKTVTLAPLFHGIEFNLEAAINSSDAWDDVVQSDGKHNGTIANFATKIIWDVKSQATDKAPRVKVTQYATEAGETIELTVKSYGSGASEAIAIKSIKYGTNKTEMVAGVPLAAGADGDNPGLVPKDADEKWSYKPGETSKSVSPTVWKMIATNGVVNNTNDAKIDIVFLKKDGTTVEVKDVQIQNSGL